MCLLVTGGAAGCCSSADAGSTPEVCSCTPPVRHGARRLADKVRTGGVPGDSLQDVLVTAGTRHLAALVVDLQN